MTIIYFLLSLTVIICLHELGHLIAAKLFGVYCYEYSFGMGPVLLQKKGKETLYSLRALPIGGFVSMAGETDGDEMYPDVIVPEGRRLTDQKPWKKIIIMLAGVTMNFILCWVILSMLMLSYGGYAVSSDPIVEKVLEGSPAEKAGMQEGDIITKVTAENGQSASPDSFLELQVFLSETQDQTLTIIVDRDGELVELSVTPEYNAEADTYRIGIQGPESTVVSINIINCWKYGFELMITLAKLMYTTLLNLVKGIGLENLSGPVGIYTATEQSVAAGLDSYVLLIAELSLNVGIFNLLPLPVLDGGQVVVTIGEWIVGRPINKKVKTGIMIACWVLLLGLMLFVTWNDIARLLG